MPFAVCLTLIVFHSKQIGIELMDDVAMDMCNNHNKLDYKVAPTL